MYDAIKIGHPTLKVTVRVRYKGGTMKETRNRLFVVVYDPSVSREMNLTVDE